MTPTPGFLPVTRPSIDEETIAGVVAVLRSGWITSGPQVKAFEARLSELCGGRPVRAMSSATGALEIALVLANVQPGDEVITPSFTFIATTEVVALLRLTPIFADVDPRTFCIDPISIEKKITKKTKHRPSAAIIYFRMAKIERQEPSGISALLHFSLLKISALTATEALFLHRMRNWLKHLK